MGQIDGYFFRTDLTEFVTERFVKYFCAKLDGETWFSPFGYYDEDKESILCNDLFPDGLYILLGSVEYPGTQPYTSHKIGQFNLISSQGIGLKILKPLNIYHDCPSVINPRGIFPLVKVGDTWQFKEAALIMQEIPEQIASIPRLEVELATIEKSTLRYRIFALRLALERNLRHPVSIGRWD